jgi:hypothetical protein
MASPAQKRESRDSGNRHKASAKFEARIQNMSDQQVEDVASTISVMTARLIWWQARNVTVGDATDKETAPRSADEIIDRNLMQAGGFEQHLFREMRDSAGFAY